MASEEQVFLEIVADLTQFKKDVKAAQEIVEGIHPEIALKIKKVTAEQIETALPKSAKITLGINNITKDKVKKAMKWKTPVLIDIGVNPVLKGDVEKAVKNYKTPILIDVGVKKISHETLQAAFPSTPVTVAVNPVLAWSGGGGLFGKDGSKGAPDIKVGVSIDNNALNTLLDTAQSKIDTTGHETPKIQVGVKKHENWEGMVNKVVGDVDKTVEEINKTSFYPKVSIGVKPSKDIDLQINGVIEGIQGKIESKQVTVNVAGANRGRVRGGEEPSARPVVSTTPVDRTTPKRKLPDSFDLNAYDALIASLATTLQTQRMLTHEFNQGADSIARLVAQQKGLNRVYESQYKAAGAAQNAILQDGMSREERNKNIDLITRRAGVNAQYHAAASADSLDLAPEGLILNKHGQRMSSKASEGRAVLEGLSKGELFVGDLYDSQTIQALGDMAKRSTLGRTLAGGGRKAELVKGMIEDAAVNEAALSNAMTEARAKAGGVTVNTEPRLMRKSVRHVDRETGQVGYRDFYEVVGPKAPAPKRQEYYRQLREENQLRKNAMLTSRVMGLEEPGSIERANLDLESRAKILEEPIKLSSRYNEAAALARSIRDDESVMVHMGDAGGGPLYQEMARSEVIKETLKNEAEIELQSRQEAAERKNLLANIKEEGTDRNKLSSVILEEMEAEFAVRRDNAVALHTFYSDSDNRKELEDIVEQEVRGKALETLTTQRSVNEQLQNPASDLYKSEQEKVKNSELQARIATNQTAELLKDTETQERIRQDFLNSEKKRKIVLEKRGEQLGVEGSDLQQNIAQEVSNKYKERALALAATAEQEKKGSSTADAIAKDQARISHLQRQRAAEVEKELFTTGIGGVTGDETIRKELSASERKRLVTAKETEAFQTREASAIAERVGIEQRNTARAKLVEMQNRNRELRKPGSIITQELETRQEKSVRESLVKLQWKNKLLQQSNSIIEQQIAIDEQVKAQMKKLRDKYRTEAAIANGQPIPGQGGSSFLGHRLMRAGGSLMWTFGMPISMAGGMGLRNYGEFDTQARKVTALTNTSPQDIDFIQKSVLDMSRDSNQRFGPMELMEGYQQIAHFSHNASENLQVLAVTSKAAASGLGTVETISDVVVSAMNAYKAPAIEAERYSDMIIRMAQEGKGRVESFAPSLGRVLPIAASAGVSFAEIAANMSMATRIGMSPEEAATGIRQIINSVVKPTKQSAEAMAAAGFSPDEALEHLRTKGMGDFLTEIMSRTGGDSEIIAKIFPNIRALTEVLASAGEQGEDYINVLRDIMTATGITSNSQEEAMQTLQFSIDSALATVKSAGVEFIEDFSGPLKRFFDDAGVWITQRIDALSVYLKTHPGAVGNITKGVIGGAALVPALMGAGAGIEVYHELSEMTKGKGGAIAKTVGVAGMGLLLQKWGKEIDESTDSVYNFGNALDIIGKAMIIGGGLNIAKGTLGNKMVNGVMVPGLLSRGRSALTGVGRGFGAAVSAYQDARMAAPYIGKMGIGQSLSAATMAGVSAAAPNSKFAAAHFAGETSVIQAALTAAGGMTVVSALAATAVVAAFGYKITQEVNKEMGARQELIDNIDKMNTAKSTKANSEAITFLSSSSMNPEKGLELTQRLNDIQMDIIKGREEIKNDGTTITAIKSLEELRDMAKDVSIDADISDESKAGIRAYLSEIEKTTITLNVQAQLKRKGLPENIDVTDKNVDTLPEITHFLDNKYRSIWNPFSWASSGNAARKVAESNRPHWLTGTRARRWREAAAMQAEMFDIQTQAGQITAGSSWNALQSKLDQLGVKGDPSIGRVLNIEPGSSVADEVEKFFSSLKEADRDTIESMQAFRNHNKVVEESSGVMKEAADDLKEKIKQINLSLHPVIVEMQGVRNRIATFGQETNKAAMQLKILQEGAETLSPELKRAAMGMANLADQQDQLRKERDFSKGTISGAIQSLISSGVVPDFLGGKISELEGLMNFGGRNNRIRNATNSLMNNSYGLDGSIVGPDFGRGGTSLISPSSALGAEIAKNAVKIRTEYSDMGKSFYQLCQRLLRMTVQGATGAYDKYFKGTAKETANAFMKAGLGTRIGKSYSTNKSQRRAGDLVYSTSGNYGHAMVVGPDGKFYDQYGVMDKPKVTPNILVRPGGDLAMPGAMESSFASYKPSAKFPKWSDEIYAASKATGVDPALIAAFIEVESSWKDGQVSKAGAAGPMQLMPFNWKPNGISNPQNAAQNIMGGAKMLKNLMNKYDGDLTKVSIAYNAGEGRVKSGSQLPEETKEYIPKIRRAYSKYSDMGLTDALDGQIEYQMPKFTLFNLPQGEMTNALSIFNNDKGNKALIAAVKNAFGDIPNTDKARENNPQLMNFFSSLFTEESLSIFKDMDTDFAKKVVKAHVDFIKYVQKEVLYQQARTNIRNARETFSSEMVDLKAQSQMIANIMNEGTPLNTSQLEARIAGSAAFREFKESGQYAAFIEGDYERRLRGVNNPTSADKKRLRDAATREANLQASEMQRRAYQLSIRKSQSEFEKTLIGDIVNTGVKERVQNMLSGKSRDFIQDSASADVFDKVWGTVAEKMINSPDLNSGSEAIKKFTDSLMESEKEIRKHALAIEFDKELARGRESLEGKMKNLERFLNGEISLSDMEIQNSVLKYAGIDRNVDDMKNLLTNSKLYEENLTAANQLQSSSDSLEVATNTLSNILSGMTPNEARIEAEKNASIRKGVNQTAASRVANNLLSDGQIQASIQNANTLNEMRIEEAALKVRDNLAYWRGSDRAITSAGIEAALNTRRRTLESQPGITTEEIIEKMSNSRFSLQESMAKEVAESSKRQELLTSQTGEYGDLLKDNSNELSRINNSYNSLLKYGDTRQQQLDTIVNEYMADMAKKFDLLSEEEVERLRRDKIEIENKKFQLEQLSQELSIERQIAEARASYRDQRESMLRGWTGEEQEAYNKLQTTLRDIEDRLSRGVISLGVANNERDLANLQYGETTRGRLDREAGRMLTSMREESDSIIGRILANSDPSRQGDPLQAAREFIAASKATAGGTPNALTPEFENSLLESAKAMKELNGITAEADQRWAAFHRTVDGFREGIRGMFDDWREGLGSIANFVKNTALDTAADYLTGKIFGPESGYKTERTFKVSKPNQIDGVSERVAQLMGIIQGTPPTAAMAGIAPSSSPLSLNHILSSGSGVASSIASQLSGSSGIQSMLSNLTQMSVPSISEAASMGAMIANSVHTALSTSMQSVTLNAATVNVNGSMGATTEGSSRPRRRDTAAIVTQVLGGVLV